MNKNPVDAHIAQSGAFVQVFVRAFQEDGLKYEDETRSEVRYRIQEEAIQECLADQVLEEVEIETVDPSKGRDSEARA
jgi:hypothetical protein